jgi:GNAT superfamily N-acetyltransferase
VTAGIRLASVADADDATGILSDGFGRDPVMEWLFGDDIARCLPTFFGFMLREALIPTGATYLSDRCCAVWTPPGLDPWSSEELGSRFMATLSGTLTAEALDRLIVLNAITDGIHPREQHWYLGILATGTDAQGGGQGSRMLAHTLARVDQDRLPAYLESSNPRNVPFYERHGFVPVGEERLPDGPTLTRMWRPTSPPG